MSTLSPTAPRSGLARHALRGGIAAVVVLAIPLVASTTVAPPAQAIPVFDPTNYAQNVLQAARALEQINNQIRSLQNEAQGLVNDARNLASLPYSSLKELQRSAEQTRQLLSQAQRIAYDVADVDKVFTSTYAPASASSSDRDLVTTARERWRNSVAAMQDAMRVQATVVGNIARADAERSALVGQSQSATGALQAAQAGNQLLALQSQQLADLTAAVAAQGRAQALEAAERSAAQDQGREQLRRFLGRSEGATAAAPTPRLFRD